MRIQELTKHIEAEITGSINASCMHLTYDSRQVGEGSMFFAIRGTKIDGHT